MEKYTLTNLQMHRDLKQANKKTSKRYKLAIDF